MLTRSGGATNGAGVLSITSATFREVASQMTHDHFSSVISFLGHGKNIVPALSYQSEVIELEIDHPGVLQRAAGSEEILLLAA